MTDEWNDNYDSRDFGFNIVNCRSGSGRVAASREKAKAARAGLPYLFVV